MKRQDQTKSGNPQFKPTQTASKTRQESPRSNESDPENGPIDHNSSGDNDSVCSAELLPQNVLNTKRTKASGEEIRGKNHHESSRKIQVTPAVTKNLEEPQPLAESDSENDSTDSQDSSANHESPQYEESVEVEDDESDDDELVERSDDDHEISAHQLVHETLIEKPSSTSLKSKTSQRRKVDPNETPEQRDARTVFVGNVHIDCVQHKSIRRHLLEHLMNPLQEEVPLITRAHIESIRFRGIPLATPIVSEKPKKQHAIQRSKAWQETQVASERSFDDVTGGRAGHRGAKPLTSNDEASAPPVKFLTANQKRKIGYVTGNLHPDAKSSIAYVVIVQPCEGSEESTNPSAQDLAKLVATKSDGTSFMDRVLRCDVASRAPSKKRTNQTQSIDVEELRRTLFIGGLDFLEQEDSIRKAVENKLLEEKKQPPDDATTWVERVRVIRDKATSLTKGFAYVLLRTQDAVEEMLALPEGSFKIGKRKVRLQKCLSSGQASALKRMKEPISNQNKNKKSRPNPTSDSTSAKKNKISKPMIDLTQEIVKPTYNGPDQSQELMNLTKSDRKKIKSNNPLRVERRLLKKQFKLKLKLLNQHNPDKKLLESLKKPVKHKNVDRSSKPRSKLNSKSKPKSGPSVKSKSLKPNRSKPLV